MKLRIRYEDELHINAFQWRPGTEKKALHFHDSLEVGLCHEGRGTFYFAEKAYPIEAGDLFVANNLDLHIAQSDPASPCLFTFLNFDATIPLEEDEVLLMPFAHLEPTFSNRIPASSPEAPALAQWVTQIYGEMSAKNAGYRSAAKSALVLLCIGLLRVSASKVPQDQWSRASRLFTKKRDLMSYLEANYPLPIELADLASFLGITVSGASRAFRETVGRSFREHLNDLRVQDAKRRLLSTDASVTDICFASGFQSIPSFYRIFHQMTGLPPQDYRKTNPAAVIFHGPPAEHQTWPDVKNREE